MRDPGSVRTPRTRACLLGNRALCLRSSCQECGLVAAEGLQFPAHPASGYKRVREATGSPGISGLPVRAEEGGCHC